MKKREKEVKEKNRNASALPIAFLIAIILAVLAYLAMLRVESNTLSNFTKSNIYVSTQLVGENTVLNEQNASQYFEQKAVDALAVPADAVTDISTLYGKAMRFDLGANTPVTMSMTYDVNKIYAQFEDPKEIGLSVSDISQAVTGVVRSGDYVDIYIYSNERSGGISSLLEEDKEEDDTDSPKLTTDTASRNKITATKPLYTNVYVSKAFDASGAIIPNDDKTTTCQRINIVLNTEDASKIYDAVQKGTVYISKKVYTSDK